MLNYYRCFAICSPLGALLVLTVIMLLAARPIRAEVERTAHFSFKLKETALTSAGVYTPDDHLVRTLWTMATLPAGAYERTWDGNDDARKPVPAGDYGIRIVLNGSVYQNVGIIGNSYPSVLHHIPHNVEAVTCDAKGNIYTADNWEEAGQDFKVMDPHGNTLFHANYQMRNGNPNGAPIGIAVDEQYIYCAFQAWENEAFKHRVQIWRFAIADGKEVPFTDPSLTTFAGHIELYVWPKKLIPPGTPAADAALMASPLKSLAVSGNTLYATDCLAGKVLRFNKATGVKQGESDLPLPTAIAIDPQGRVWVGHEHGKISVFGAQGVYMFTPIENLREIRSLAFAPDGRLYVADGGANRVYIYATDNVTHPELQGTFGDAAKPGDFAPDRFYTLRGATVDAFGNLITIAQVPGGGIRIAKFDALGKNVWEKFGLTFCNVGNYCSDTPDEMVDSRFNRYLLTNKQAGKWEYRGSMLDGNYHYLQGNHGVERLYTLGGRQFFFQCYGNGVQVYRRDGEIYHFVAMIGNNDPEPDGTFQADIPVELRKGDNRYSWTDLNGDGKVDAREVITYVPRGEGGYATSGMNVEPNGTIIYCDLYNNGVWELPMAGLDARGNPVYDWRLAHMVVPADTMPNGYTPYMAVRAEDGSIYTMGRSKHWPLAESDWPFWMAGQVVARYDNEGRRLWITCVPRSCPGLCEIPNGKGVMLMACRDGEIYHLDSGGLLIGKTQPGAAAAVSGWSDNTAAIAVNRDARDGQLDLFCEDSWLNRMIWYRVNDRNISTISTTLSLK